MPFRPNPLRLVLCLLALGGIAVVSSGCGTEIADTTRGRQLFLANCATCHTLAQAGQGAQIGPNLDDAFAAAREAGQDSDTIKGVVLNQIEYPRPSNGDPAVSMPPDLVTGQDAKDVAAYVAEFAGVPGAAPPKVPGGPGAQVFADNVCGSCHTLAAAKSGGTTGPNLDDVLPGMTASEIHTDIINPNANIAKGYPPNVMPQNYSTQIAPNDLNDLVQYLLTSTGGGKGGSAKSGGGGAKSTLSNTPG
jgi:mono/diheme cytochrome c family protein